MNPSVDARIDSLIRALSQVILPALREDAGLAKEQGQLVLGHLAILRAQIDGTAAFEAEEADDIAVLSRALVAVSDRKLAAPLQAVLDDGGDGHPRDHTDRLQRAVDSLLVGLHNDGGDAWEKARAIVLRLGSDRAMKDRRQFAPMGFDAFI